MDSAGFPIDIVQNMDFFWPITYQDSNGNPINLAGYSAQMQVRQTINSSNPAIIDVSTANGNIVITAATGLIAISIPHSITSALTAPLKANYDVVITDGTGLKTRLVYGIASIAESVTR